MFIGLHVVLYFVDVISQCRIIMAIVRTALNHLNLDYTLHYFYSALYPNWDEFPRACK